jgi:putative ABC transport system permease protein
MRAVLTKAWSEVRRRRLQSAVIVVMVALASGTITLALNLLLESRSPYDRAFQEQNGAHLKVFYDARQVNPGQLASTPAAIGASSSAGPWPNVHVTVLHRESSPGQSRHQLDLVGRDSPQGAAERLRLASGRWVQAPGEIVVTRAFAAANRIGLGDHLVSLHTADKPALTVVGETVDISQTVAGSDYSSIQSISRAQRAWVPPSQVADLAGGSGLGYQMAYRFRSPPGQAQLRDAMERLRASLPPGAIAGSSTYLVTRDAYQANNQFLLILLLAFGIFALVASLATTINLVLGTVLAGYRDIGISKALGFTPLQVVASLVAAMTIPALAGCAVGIPAGAALSLPLIRQAAQACCRLDLLSPPTVSPLAVLLALAGILLCVVAAAAIPALRAGRMSAVQAIAAGGAPRSPRAWRPSRRLQHLRVPRPLSLGAGDAFARPLRGGLTVLAVLIGVATIVVASGLREALVQVVPVTSQVNGDVSLVREPTVSDRGVMAILNDQSQTHRVLASRNGPVVVPGLADPVDSVAFRGDARDLGWSMFLVRGRWPGTSPGEVLLRRSVLEQAGLDVGSLFDGVIAGHPLRLQVVGEITATDFGALLDWSTLTAADPGAEPDRYVVQLRPGSDAGAYAAAIRAREPDFLTVESNRVVTETTSDTLSMLNALMAILVLVLALIAAAGVFSTMLLQVRERSRDIAILKAVGMTPRQLLTMVMTSSAVLGVIGGLVAMPLGVRAYHGLMTALARQIGNRPPPFAFDVLPPATLYPLGVMGLAIALAGAVFPARRAARSRAAAMLRSE